MRVRMTRILDGMEMRRVRLVVVVLLVKLLGGCFADKFAGGKLPTFLFAWACSVSKRAATQRTAELNALLMISTVRTTSSRAHDLYLESRYFKAFYHLDTRANSLFERF